ncbi:MAG: HlyD family type I secretion periplasmic adaptor subunit [Candidatus Thiodiazotropha sp. 6PLUC9]
MINYQEEAVLQSVTSINSLKKIGTSLFVLFFVFFGGWAVLVPLGGAVIAQGQVIKEGKSKEISHELGGVVSEILVKEGMRVKAGDVLVVLDDVDRRSVRNRLQAQQETLAITQARLFAEQKGAETFTIEGLSDQNKLLSRSDFNSPQFQAALQDQMKQFITRKLNRTNAVALLVIERDTFEQEINGIKDQITALNERIASYSNERKMLNKVVKQGYTRAADLRQIEREMAEAKEDHARLKTELHTLPMKMMLTTKRIQQIEDEFAEKLSADISENRQKLVEVTSQLEAAENAVARVELTAPVSGVIDKIYVNTVGSAVAAYTPIVEIVPENESLIVEVQVNPTDIDLVLIGQDAQVVMSAFDRNEVLPAKAKTIFISPDRRVNETNGTSYFAARLEVDPAEIAKLPPVSAGMPVEAYLKTKERTFAGIIFEPFTDSIRRSFRG